METQAREKFATQVNSEILAPCAALQKARGGSCRRSSRRR